MRVVLGAFILLLADFSDTEGRQKNSNINKNEHYSRTRFLAAKHNYYNRLPRPATRITEWNATTISPLSAGASPNPSRRENTAKYRKFLRKERGKLRKSLKNSKVRENKNARDSILRRINEINAEIRKYATKNRQRKRKHRKHNADVNKNKSNILDVTTARNKNILHRWNLNDNASLNKVIKKLNQNPEVDFSNDLKIYEQPNSSSRSNKSVHKFRLNDTSDYKNDFNLLTKTPKNNRASALTTVTPVNATLTARRFNSGTDKNKTGPPHSTVMPTNTVSKINYADLMKIQTTTMPPMKNVSLDTILEEFNVISNQIGVLFPGRQKYPRYNLTKNVEPYKRRKTRCSYKKGGCEHVCHPKGPRKCTCLNGFKLAVNKRQCLDINECLKHNGGCTNVCHNTPGSYYCSCSIGLRLSGDGRSCEDINECLLRNGHGPCQDTCRNTHGSYECYCTGLNGTRLGADKHSCEDVDECTEGRSGCSHGCVNTLGRAYCTCPDGMELGSDWKTCKDVDECDDNEISKCKFGCINTIGSYFCTDDFDVQSDQSVSPIPDHVACSPLFPPNHGFLECSREKGLRVKMRSRSGRTRVTNRPGTFCQLVCPADRKLVGSFQVICGLDGRWIGDKSGTCSDS